MEQPHDSLTARPKVTGARPKSSALPGGGRPGAATAGTGVSSTLEATASSGAAAVKIVAEYRQRLIDLYEVHNPANVARVDTLLKKYRGQEEYLYRQVCAKYGKAVDEPLPKAVPSASTQIVPASAPGQAARPPPKAAQSNAGDGRTAKMTVGAKSHAVVPYNGSGSLPARVGDGGAQSKLLSRIDFLLIGERTGFFECSAAYLRSDESVSSESGSESCSESGSEDDEEEGVAIRSVGKTGVPAAPGNRMAVAATGVSRGKRSGAAANNDVGDDEENSEISDDVLADALAAKLQQGSGRQAGIETAASKAAGRPPLQRRDLSAPPLPPLRRVNVNGAGDATLTARSKAASNAVGDGAKPKAKARAPEGGAEENGDFPPLFDQWLACLKFLVGWNEARPQSEKEIKDAFREHLKEESIDNAHVVDRLCATVVPLLLDVRRIDGAVVKNVRVAVLKSLKTVQVSILRVVAYELCRELEAKLVARKKKAEGQKVPKVDAAGATYLASDISSLAKVVQHYRFDRVFSGGLHQLITSIRQQGRNLKNGGAAATTDGSKKRKAPDAEAQLTRKRSRADS